MWNLVKLGQAVSLKKTFKDYDILYMKKKNGQGQITPGAIFFFFFVTNSFSYFDKPLAINTY